MTTDGREVKMHGCFRCGAINEGFEIDEEGFAVCLCCGERSVVDFQQALDLLNDFYRRGYSIIDHPEQQEGLEYDE